MMVLVVEGSNLVLWPKQSKGHSLDSPDPSHADGAAARPPDQPAKGTCKAHQRLPVAQGVAAGPGLPGRGRGPNDHNT